jgi:hypothetical protein
VSQLGDGLGFLLEVLGFCVAHMGVQQLNGGLQLEPNMLAQVHFSIATLSQQANQPVVAILLSHPIGHYLGLHGADYRICKASCHTIVGSEATPVKVIPLGEAHYDTIIRNKSESLSVLLTN